MKYLHLALEHEDCLLTIRQGNGAEGMPVVMAAVGVEVEVGVKGVAEGEREGKEKEKEKEEPEANKKDVNTKKTYWHQRGWCRLKIGWWMSRWRYWWYRRLRLLKTKSIGCRSDIRIYLMSSRRLSILLFLLVDLVTKLKI